MPRSLARGLCVRYLSGMRVLVIEDYPPTRKAVVKALREEGHSVDEADNGADGLWRSTRGAYDVIVLDLMLPQVDGMEILKTLRKEGSKAHVIVLTAKDRVEDRVEGLDHGADDYLVKPFATEELLARVRALLRREYQQKDPVLRVGTSRSTRPTTRSLSTAPRSSSRRVSTRCSSTWPCVPARS